MENCIREAVEALAALVPNAAALEALLDSVPSTIVATPEVACWVGYLLGAADAAGMTVRELLDEHGVSVAEVKALAPAAQAALPDLPRSDMVAVLLDFAKRDLRAGDETATDVRLVHASEGWALNVGHPGYERHGVEAVLTLDADVNVLAVTMVQELRAKRGLPRGGEVA